MYSARQYLIVIRFGMVAWAGAINTQGCIGDFSVSNLFLSEASDSKLIRIGDYHAPASEEIYLRLRLQSLMKILFRQKLYITEGWALDSVPFIKIAAEIISAINALYQEGNRSSGLARFSPIVMEVKREGNFLDVFQWYAKRMDTRWSGFMPHVNDIRERQSISEALLIEKRCGKSPAEVIRTVFASLEFMPGKFFADDMACVAEYFSQPVVPGCERMLRINPNASSFYGHFDSFLRNEASDATPLDSKRSALARTAKTALEQGRIFSTSSLAMEFADSQDDPQVRDALMRAINIVYMKVSSDAVQAQMVTPAHRTGTVDEEVDKMVVSSLKGSPDHYDLLFLRGYNSEHGLAEKFALLAAEDWRSIWKNTIRLALSKEWELAVNGFAQQVMRYGYRNAIRSPCYENIETLLKKHVPELVIEYSLAARIFKYRGSESIRKKFSSIAGSAVGGTVEVAATYAIKHSVPAAEDWGAIAFIGAYASLKVGAAILKESFPERLNFLANNSIGATRSSILDPKIRK
jgi:hypothetical protein